MKYSKIKTYLILLFCVAVSAALVGSVVLYLAMDNDYDASIKHFEFGSVFATSALAISIGGAALGLVGFIISPEKKIDLDPKRGDYTFVGVFFSILTGLMSALYFVSRIRQGIPEEKPGLLMAEMAFSALSVAFFTIKAAGILKKKKNLSILGISPALACAFMLLNLYFSRNEPLNAPLKIYETVMLISFMLYFTADTGISISRKKMNRKYVFAGLFAATTGGTIALSRIAIRIVNVDVFDFDIIKTAFCAVMWLYVVFTFGERLIMSREKSNEEALLEEKESAEEKEAETDAAESGAAEAETAQDGAQSEVENASEDADEAEDAKSGNESEEAAEADVNVSDDDEEDADDSAMEDAEPEDDDDITEPEDDGADADAEKEPDELQDYVDEEGDEPQHKAETSELQDYEDVSEEMKIDTEFIEP
ncbi:MAG: hypothetical protein IKN38_02445 [Clostridia bacterium]|nr:hypothetical protein [Clostridia bacterium]